MQHVRLAFPERSAGKALTRMLLKGKRYLWLVTIGTPEQRRITPKERSEAAGRWRAVWLRAIRRSRSPCEVGRSACREVKKALTSTGKVYKDNV